MTDSRLKEVEVYADGSARGNPGPGGYGIVLRHGEHVKEISAGFKRTTNNRMELLGVIVALETLKLPCSVTIHSDSRYVVGAIDRGSARKWRAKGWLRTRTAKAKNIDLWERFLVASEQHDIRVVWVPGHAGVPDNERCDELAVAASQNDDLPEDTGYQDAAESDLPAPENRAASTGGDAAGTASQQLTFDL